MKAKDVMTAPVISVGPTTPVPTIARQLLARHISAVPVVDDHLFVMPMRLIGAMGAQ